MPTSCSWIADQDASSNFVVTYQEPVISLFDASTGKEKGLINYQYDESKVLSLQQINKVIVSEEQKLIIAGTEDNLIRFFDLNSYKQVKSIVAHTDSVTSLLIPNVHSTKHSTNNTVTTSYGLHSFVSGGHDGALRAWDLRTFQCTFDTIAHRRKFDEGVLALASSDKYTIIASGGADSLIKIMHEQ